MIEPSDFGPKLGADFLKCFEGDEDGGVGAGRDGRDP